MWPAPPHTLQQTIDVIADIDEAPEAAAKLADTVLAEVVTDKGYHGAGVLGTAQTWDPHVRVRARSRSPTLAWQAPPARRHLRQSSAHPRSSGQATDATTRRARRARFRPLLRHRRNAQAPPARARQRRQARAPAGRGIQSRAGDAPAGGSGPTTGPHGHCAPWLTRSRWRCEPWCARFSPVMLRRGLLSSFIPHRADALDPRVT
jgi:hypothetical protein